jgi:hypothetical protein
MRSWTAGFEPAVCFFDGVANQVGQSTKPAIWAGSVFLDRLRCDR